MITNRPIICVLGGPGCGKGTQCDKIVAKYGLVHISTGDLIREKIESKTASATTLQDIVKEGKLISNEEILRLLKDAIEKLRDTATGFLIDGYPREKSQGPLFEQAIAPITAFLFFDANEDVLTSRLKFRAKTSHRDDDNDETIKKRLTTYAETVTPIRELYNDRIIVINAERGVDEIFTDVQKSLDPILIGKSRKCGCKLKKNSENKNVK